MGHLRQKLEQDPARPGLAILLLKPVLGIGLCFEKSGNVWIKSFFIQIRNLIFKKCSIQFLIINDTVAHKEQVAMREMNQLVNTEDSAWPIIQNWLKDATNHTELLPVNKDLAETALYQLQVTTKSPMGALVYGSYRSAD